MKKMNSQNSMIISLSKIDGINFMVKITKFKLKDSYILLADIQNDSLEFNVP